MILFFVLLTAGMMISPGEMKTVEELEKELEFLKIKMVDIESKNENLEERLTTKMRDMMADFAEKMETRLDAPGENIDGSAKERIITTVNEKSRNNTDERLDYLEEVSKMNVKRSCEEMRQFGITTSGAYFVDPDGPLLGSSPFRVWCEFTQGGLAITEVLHDSEDLIEVGHCKEAGCYVHPVIYTAPQDQIQSLILLSQGCEQSVRYDCFLAPLMSNDINFGYWIDREGQEQIYWHGAHAGEHVCSCFYEEEGCTDEETKFTQCNCDAQVPDMLSDIGSITNKTALPIQELAFGGLEYPAQQAFHALGRLRCWGSKEVEEGTSCAALKRSGQFHSGFYNVRKDEASNSQLVYCNMTITPGYEVDDGSEVFVESSEDHFNNVEEAIGNIKDDISANGGKITTNAAKISVLEHDTSTNAGKISGLEDEVDVLEMKSSFCGYQDEWTSHGTALTYDSILVEDNNVAGASFNTANGLFTSGTTGTYQVSLNIGYLSGSGSNTNSELYFRHNGVDMVESQIYSKLSTGQFEMGGRSMLIHLSKGDYIDVKVKSLVHMYRVTFCLSLVN